MPYELTTNQKTRFDVLSPLTLCHSNKLFLISLWRVMKSGFYKTTAVTSCGWTEKKLQNTPQSHTWFKKRSWSLFGGLLLLWLTSTFWILVKPLHLRRMLSKSMRCTKNCNTCRPHWSLEGVQFSSMTTACRAQPTLQKLNELGYEVLLHLPYSPDLFPTEYHFFKHLNNLMRGKRFHNQQEAKDAFQEFVES